MYNLKNPSIITYHGIDRTRETPNNYFEEYTFSNFPHNNNYSHDQYAFWQGPRHRQDTIEYFRSTNNGKYYRAESQDELENRVISPGWRNYWDEITPERLAEDPEDAIHKYYNGWNKNLSDGAVAINIARSRDRIARRGNYTRISNQMHRYLIMTNEGTNGFLYNDH